MRFTREYAFLSNFHYSPFDLPIKDEAGRFHRYSWACVETAYQAHKSLSAEFHERVRTLSPSDAKKAGRAVLLRPDWEAVKIPTMGLIVWHKFAQNPVLAQLLIRTGETEIVEDNAWGDTFWGRCGGSGQNMLGTILMEVRQAIRNSAPVPFHYIDV